jgi:Lateral organ boundaries (LOB) domain
VQILPVHERAHAADSLSTEAYWRVKDPVYGGTGVVLRMQQEIAATRCELAITSAQISMHEAHNPPEQQPPPPTPLPQQLDTSENVVLLFEPNDPFNLS